MSEPAVEWGRALRHVMTHDSVPVKKLAAALGVNPAIVSQYRQGHQLPRVARAAEIADALMAPHLLALCTKLRTIACEECGTEFVRDQRGGHLKRWCSKQCSDRYRTRVIYANDRRWTGKRYDTWKRKAEKLQASVNAMCRACEPEGACRDSGCELRSVSPLPLIEVRPVPRAEKGTIRRGPGAAQQEHRREYNREWMRRKRAAA